MNTTDFSYKFLKELHNAAALWVSNGEPQLILQLIGELQQESIKEGYESAIEVLQNNFKEIIGG